MNNLPPSYRRKIFYLVIFCLLFTLPGMAQNFTVEEVERKLAGLSEKEKVTFIHTNFYKIYSADLGYASKLTRLSTELSHKNGWKDQEGYGLVYQGVAAFLLGDYEHALPFYNKATDLFDSLHNLDGLALVHNETAVFFGRHRDYKRSYEHLDLSLKYSTEANNLEQQGTTLGHKAALMEREGKVGEAFEIYKKVYAIRLQQKDSVGLGYILLDLAMGEQRKKNLKGALHFIEQSTVIRKKIGDQQGIAINLMTIADTYVAFQQYTKAIPYFEKGLQEAYKVGYDDLVRYGYDHLSEAYILMKDFQSAYLSQKKAHAFNDSLFNIERTKVIADLQTKYETEKKEQELALQRATVAEQKAELEKNFAVIAALAVTLVLLSVIFFLVRNRFRRKQDLLKKEHDLSLRDGLIRASIQSQEIERKRFAQDLHDGMGQLISSLRLSVARMGFEADTKERVNIFSKSEKILNDMHQEIRSIAFNLMPQTLIQFGLIPALEEMAQRVSASGKIIVNVKGFDIPQRLAEVQEISLYRVIQEWVNNITKYSDATAVEVQLVGYESEITVIVEDNGNGFDTSVLAAGKGHGWRNIQSRLNLIRSTVEVDSRAGVKGTTMIIHLPFQKESVQEENVEAGHDRM